MRKKSPVFSLVLFFTITAFITCNKRYDPSIPNPYTPLQTITTAIDGKVIDENNKGVAAVIVEINGVQAVTDRGGRFQFEDIIVNKKFVKVLVKKSGYFEASRTILPDEKNNFIAIKLIPRVQVAQVVASQGGNVVIKSSNCSIDFKANSFVTEDNKIYNGSVNVYASYLNPEENDFGQIMPGNLITIDSATNKMQGLQSYGMVTVELESADGRPVNIATGMNATLQFGIPRFLNNNSPAMIPLWFFDENKGYWVQQGQATKKGERYEGEVSHFTYWNLDVNYDLIEIRGSFSNTNKNAAAHRIVHLYDPVSKQSIYTLTNANGVFQTWIPANIDFKLTLLDDCLYSFHDMDVPGAASNIDLGAIKIADTRNALTIKGRLVDCDSKPVNNGSVFINFEGRSYDIADTRPDGTFELNVFGCIKANYYQIKARNNETMEENIEQIVSVSSNTLSDLGNIITCGNINEDFIQVIRGTDTLDFRYPEYPTIKAIIFNPPNSFNSATLRVYADNRTSDFYEAHVDLKNITESFIAPGNAQFIDVGLATTDSIPFYNVPYGTTVPPVNITEFGTVGNYIAGTFDGTLRNATRNGYTFDFKIKFRVKRYQ